MSLLSPIYTAAATLLARLTSARALKLDQLDAAITSRASADTALSNATWTATRAAKLDQLDAAITSRASADTALSSATWTAPRAAKLDQLDAAVSSRMAGIKGIQRGTITLSAASTSGTATITAVNMAKTELRYLGAASQTPSIQDMFVRLSLTNSTTITATRGHAVDNTVTVSWELTEYL